MTTEGYLSASRREVGELKAEVERLRSDPYKGQWKRKCMQAEAERDALRAENGRLLEMLKLAEADIKVMIGEARPCPHTNHTYRNHGGTRVCADCGAVWYGDEWGRSILELSKEADQ